MGCICNLTPDFTYYLCMYSVDIRKQFNGLQGIITQEFGVSVRFSPRLVENKDLLLCMNVRQEFV